MTQPPNDWIKPYVKKPVECDLVNLQLDNGKTIHGWWTGAEWYAYRMPSNTKVVAWKRKRVVDFH